MASSTKDMTQGKPIFLIVSFALPLMAGNVFQQLYTVVDTMVVGRALGVHALAALGSADWLNWMMLGIIQGLTQGFAIPMAQAFGGHRDAQLRRTIGVSAVLSAGCAVVLVLFGQLLIGPALQMIRTPAEIRSDSTLYLRIMFFGVPIVMAYNYFASVLRAMGDGKTPLYAMILASGINIALDLLFVLVFHWGIAGAAAATLTAQAFSALFCLKKLSGIRLLQLSREDFKADMPMVLRLLQMGIPIAFQNMLIAVGGIIVQSVVNTCGVLFIAGFTATNKLYGLLEIAASSFGYAIVTYVGQNLGAGNLKRIREGQKAAVLVALATSLVIMAIMLLSGKMILSCFISGTPDEISATLEIAYSYLTVMSLWLPVLYILYVARSAIQGMGNTWYPMLSGIAEFIMRTVVVFLLPLAVGEVGIFYAEVLAWLGADLVLVPGYCLTLRKCANKMLDR